MGNVIVVDHNGMEDTKEGLSYIQLQSTGKKYLFYTKNEMVDPERTKVYVSEVGPGMGAAGKIEDTDWNGLRGVIMGMGRKEVNPDVVHLPMDGTKIFVGAPREIAVKADLRQALMDNHTESMIAINKTTSQDVPAIPVPNTGGQSAFFNTAVTEPAEEDVPAYGTEQPASIFANPMQPMFPEANPANVSAEINAQINTSEQQVVTSVQANPMDVPAVGVPDTLAVGETVENNVPVENPQVQANVVSENVQVPMTEMKNDVENPQVINNVSTVIGQNVSTEPMSANAVMSNLDDDQIIDMIAQIKETITIAQDKMNETIDKLAILSNVINERKQNVVSGNSIAVEPAVETPATTIVENAQSSAQQENTIATPVTMETPTQEVVQAVPGAEMMQQTSGEINVVQPVIENPQPIVAGPTVENTTVVESPQMVTDFQNQVIDNNVPSMNNAIPVYENPVSAVETASVPTQEQGKVLTLTPNGQPPILDNASADQSYDSMSMGLENIVPTIDVLNSGLGTETPVNNSYQSYSAEAILNKEPEPTQAPAVVMPDGYNNISGQQQPLGGMLTPNQLPLQQDATTYGMGRAA